MLGEPTGIASHHRGDAQCEALLAEQRVAAVARTERPNVAGLGEVNDVLVVRVARPRRIDVAGCEWGANRVHAWHPIAVAECVECALAHTGHDAHVGGYVGGVAELHANVCNRRAERTHAERHHIHGAALHRAGEQRGHLDAHFGRVAPVVVGAGVGWIGRADERAVFDSGNVARIAVRPITVGTLGFVELGECAAVDQCLAQALVFIGAAVAPVDAVGLEDFGPVIDPLMKTRVVTRTAH